MAMETSKRLSHSSKFVSSVKKAVAFAALGFQVLASPMLLSCTNGTLSKTIAVSTPEKDMSQLNKDLLYAAREGDIEAVKRLLAKGADVNAKDNWGITALMWTAWPGHTEIVNLLISKGADVNAKDKNGRTALMEAAAGGHTEIVEMLMERGADVNSKDNYGITTLFWALQHRHPEIVVLLMMHGAKE